MPEVTTFHTARRRAPRGCTPACFRARARAFTLVELLIVAGIVALLAGIALPRYQSALNRYRVTNAANRLAADLLAARDGARAASAKRSVTFGTSGSYTVQGAVALEGRSATVNLADEPYTCRITRVRYNGSSTGTFSFDGYGNASAALSVTLVAGTDTRVVSVDQQTGTPVVSIP